MAPCSRFDRIFSSCARTYLATCVGHVGSRDVDARGKGIPEKHVVWQIKPVDVRFARSSDRGIDNVRSNLKERVIKPPACWCLANVFTKLPQQRRLAPWKAHCDGRPLMGALERRRPWTAARGRPLQHAPVAFALAPSTQYPHRLSPRPRRPATPVGHAALGPFHCLNFHVTECTVFK